MKMIFLVDGDNNIGTGLQGIDLLTAEDSVLIFYGKGQSTASIQKLCANTRAPLFSFTLLNIFDKKVGICYT